MEAYLHFKPNCDLLLQTGSLSVMLKKNKISTLLSRDFGEVHATIYPVGEAPNAIPYVCTLRWSNGNILCDKSCVDVIKFPKNNFLIKVSPFKLSTSRSGPSKSELVFFGGTTHTLTWSKNNKLSLRIENSQDDKFIDLKDDDEVCEIFSHPKDDKVFIYLKTKEGRYIFYLVEYKDCSYKVLDSSKAKYINVDDDKIVTYLDLCDMAGHGIVKTYLLNEDLKINSTLVYDNQKPALASSRDIIPYAFFDAIKLKNFKLARVYLSKNLSERLTNEHLEKYFGNFEEVTQTLSPQFSAEEIALIYTFPIKHAQIFYLTFDKDNKILNITKD